MKKLLHIALLAFVVISSCKKEDKNNTETSVSAPVTIGGKEYPTIKIGTKTWTATNYNGSSDGGVEYKDLPNDPAYGKLYSLVDAQSIKLPAGWRLPTKDDFIDLLSNAGKVTIDVNGPTITVDAALKLTSTTGWNNGNGNNSLGFNAFPTGFGTLDTKTTFINRMGQTIFWSSTAAPYEVVGTLTFKSQYALIMSCLSGGENYTLIFPPGFTPYRLCSIRFVKDN